MSQDVVTTQEQVHGLKYVRRLRPLFKSLYKNATQRDKAGNRRLFYDQYAALLALSFFDPSLDNLRAIELMSQSKKVQKVLHCGPVSRTSLSDASTVFDPQLLHGIIRRLAKRYLPLACGREVEALRGLTAVDGSLLPALPKMVWALWQDDQNRAAKMHVHFDVFRGIPVDVSVTAGNDSERDELRKKLADGGFYVFDRGYRDWKLFQNIADAKASFVGRVQDNTVIDADKERDITPAAKAAGVVRDAEVIYTGNRRRNHLRHTLRLVVIDSGKRLSNGKADLVVLCTNRLDLPAELVGLAYKYRWLIEIFFRWLKMTLGCRHLLANRLRGVTIQVYVAIIVSLLIAIVVQRKPDKRTLEAMRMHVAGLFTAGELLTILARLNAQANRKKK
jgi:Transposase DDE domain